MNKFRGIVTNGAMKLVSYLGEEMEEDGENYRLSSVIDETSGELYEAVRLPKQFTILQELKVEGAPSPKKE